MIIVPALAGTMIPVALAQTEGQIPSVSVRPVGTTESDPNGGQWFVESIEPEQTKRLGVRLHNPATVAQKVKLYLADIHFDAQGTPEVANVPTDIGTWGRFNEPTVTIGPRETVDHEFSITAPKGADPGDHVGAVVAEHTPQGDGNIRSVKRVAIRLYATLPGDARRDFVIDKVTVKKDSAFFARELTVTVELRNTGRVRLEPTVMVDGAKAKGPELLMSNAVERFVVTRPVRFWGGPIRLRVDAETRSLGIAGPVRQTRVTTWVIPWHLFVLLAMVAGLVMLVRTALRKRGSKYRAIQADLGRLERLLAQQSHQAPTPDVIADGNDPAAAIRAAIKQAKRAGDTDTAERLEAVLGSASKKRVRA